MYLYKLLIYIYLYCIIVAYKYVQYYYPTVNYQEDLLSYNMY